MRTGVGRQGERERQTNGETRNPTLLSLTAHPRPCKPTAVHMYARPMQACKPICSLARTCVLARQVAQPLLQLSDQLVKVAARDVGQADERGTEALQCTKVLEGLGITEGSAAEL